MPAAAPSEAPRVTDTILDRQVAYDYANERVKLHLYNWFLKRYPSLFSEVILEIYPAEELFPQLTDKMRDRAIRVRLRTSERWCEKARCNMMYPRRKQCNDTHDNLRIYSTGNTVDTACERGCYDIFSRKAALAKPQQPEQQETENNPVPRVLTAWSDRCNTCIVYNQLLYAYASDDARRAEHDGVPHLSTIGTGYDRISTPMVHEPSGEEGQAFRLNSQTCREANLSLTGDGRRCGNTWGAAISSFVIGDTMTNMIRYAFQDGIRGIKPSDVRRPDVTEISSKTRKKLFARYDSDWHQLNLERAFYINPELVLSQLGFNRTNYHLRFTTQHDSFGGGLLEPLVLWKEIPLPPPQFRAHSQYPARRHLDEFVLIKAVAPPVNSIFDPAARNARPEDHASAAAQYATSAAQAIAPVAASYLLRYTFGKAIPRMLNRLEARGFGEFAASTLVQGMLDREVMRVATAATFDLAVDTSLLLAGTVLPFVDALLMLLMFVDFFVTLLVGDPLRLQEAKQLGTQEHVDGLSTLGMFLNESSFGHRTLEFSPAMFMLLHRRYYRDEEQLYEAPEWGLCHDTVRVPAVPWACLGGSIDVQGWLGKEPELFAGYALEYLRELRVNSDGSRITVFEYDRPVHVQSLRDRYAKVGSDSFVAEHPDASAAAADQLRRLYKTRETIFVLGLVCILPVFLARMFTEKTRALQALCSFLLLLLALVHVLVLRVEQHERRNSEHARRSIKRILRSVGRGLKATRHSSSDRNFVR